ERLARSTDGLESLGRRWFPIALHAALTHTKDARELHHLRGLWLEREGRLSQAADALRQAVTAKATVASTVDLVRLLAAQGDHSAAQELGERLKVHAPGATGALDAALQDALDLAETRTYERLTHAAPPELRVAQALRYARLGRPADAQGVIYTLVDEYPTLDVVFDAAVGLYLRWRQLGRLAQLIARAEGAELPPARLRQARVAAVLAARLAATQGASPHALSSRDISGDLVALAASDTLGARRLAWHGQVVVAATRQGHEGLDAAVAQALRRDMSAMTLKVVAAAWLSVGQMDRAIATLNQGIASLPPSKRGAPSLSLASLEIAVGAGRLDRALLRRGLSRLDDLALSHPSDLAVRDYLRAVGGRIAMWTGSAVRSPEGAGGSDEAALRALLPLVDRIDPTDPRGAVFVAASALSAGALGLALGSYD
ncbi:MAG: hypothetical protein QF464_20410, partial [Myxococcota bacterium]|nr:hypothetical protein [Myxococcota bacterium]